MKPLTIEELKVGEWVWVVDIESPKHGSGYWQIHGFAKTHIHFNQGAARWVAPKALYGKGWAAYRNKEEAERSIPDVTKKCCANCRRKGFGEDRCDKLNQLFTENGVQLEDKVYSSTNDKWIKRNDIMEDNCCDDFNNRWLEYPIAVAETQIRQPIYNQGLGHKTGELVRIRPCGDEYKGKTYLGFYLGDLPLSITQSLDCTTHILNIFTHDNPAIFVPSLGKIIFGCESWWGKIDKPEELEDITDECIHNQWYIKALKELDKKE